MATILLKIFVKCIVRNDKKQLKFVFKGPNDNNSGLVHVIGRCLTADKLLPESMLTKILTPYDVTRPQWIKHVEVLAK